MDVRRPAACAMIIALAAAGSAAGIAHAQDMNSQHAGGPNTCPVGMEKVVRAASGSLACVTPSSKAILIERGWALPPAPVGGQAANATAPVGGQAANATAAPPPAPVGGQAANATAAPPPAPVGGQAANATAAHTAPTSAAAAHDRATKAAGKAHSLAAAVRNSPQATGDEFAEAAEAAEAAAEAWVEATEAWVEAGDHERAGEGWEAVRDSMITAIHLGGDATSKWVRSGDKKKVVQWDATNDMVERWAVWSERLAEAWAEAGNYEQAAAAYGTAAMNWRQLGHLLEGQALGGADERAAEMSERSAAMVLKAGLIRNAIDQYRETGKAWAEAGNHDRAAAAYERAGDLLEREADEWEAAGGDEAAAYMRHEIRTMFDNAGSMLRGLNANEHAAAMYERAGDKVQEASSWAEAGNYDRAAAAYMVAGDEYEVAGNMDGAGNAYWSAGRSWADAGDNERARAAYEQALAILPTGSSWSQLIEQDIADLD